MTGTCRTKTIYGFIMNAEFPIRHWERSEAIQKTRQFGGFAELLLGRDRLCCAPSQ